VAELLFALDPDARSMPHERLFLGDTACLAGIPGIVCRSIGEREVAC